MSAGCKARACASWPTAHSAKACTHGNTSLNRPSVVRNILANFAGRGWSILLSFALVPLYIRFLGVEAYGLIGFYVTLTTVATVFDPGFGTTLTREFAREAGSPDTGRPFRATDVLRTLEVLSMGAAVTIASGVAMLAPTLASSWLRAESLDAGLLSQAIATMGLALAAQWLTPLYSGGLSGLQQQVRLNLILAAGATVRGLGSLFVLAFVANDVRAFFAWQAFAFSLQSLALGIVLWQHFPKRWHAARFHLRSLAGAGRFTTGVWAITLLGTAASQADKVLLSALLPLAQFGHYMLAATAASIATLLVGPIFNAVMPRLTELVARGVHVEVTGFYHGASQLVATVTLPLALTLIAFAPELLHLWLGDRSIATEAAPIVRALAVAATINALLNTPYALQLAYGWTRLGVGMGLFNLVAVPPVIWLGATHLGAVGAAGGYALVCLANLTIGMGLLHARHLCGEGRNWLLRDTLPPALAAALVVGAASQLVPEAAGPLATGVGIAATLCSALVASAFAARSTREQLMRIPSAILARRGF